LKLPEIQSMTNPTESSVKSAMINLNSKLFSSAVRVSMDTNNRLKEIKICYNLALQPISCYT
jgi:ribonuclease I